MWVCIDDLARDEAQLLVVVQHLRKEQTFKG